MYILFLRTLYVQHSSLLPEDDWAPLIYSINITNNKELDGSTSTKRAPKEPHPREKTGC
jgi:hypothetical protein